MEQMRQSAQNVITDIIHNPLFTGIGPFPRIINDEEWVKCMAKSAENNGPDYAYLKMTEAVEKSFGISAIEAVRSEESLTRLKREILEKGAEPFFANLLKDLRKSLRPLS
ncbi:MAG TPA: hypothetical protein VGJ94_13500 [Syntrophorhabdaceae bacterium]|jgi:mannosyltransferase OCH1-like enzyme